MDERRVKFPKTSLKPPGRPFENCKEARFRRGGAIGAFDAEPFNRCGPAVELGCSVALRHSPLELDLGWILVGARVSSLEIQ